MKILNKLMTVCLLLLMTVGAAQALPTIKFKNGQKLSLFYDAQFGLTARNGGSEEHAEGDSYEFNFRRNRLGFYGTMSKDFNYFVQLEYIEDRKISGLNVNLNNDNDNNLYILDAQLRYKMNDYFKIVLGKFKHNLTRENLEACFNPLNFDRSLFVYAPFKTSRDRGVAVWGNFLDNHLQYKVDIMEGRAGDEVSGSPEPSSNFRYTGRVHLTLFDKEKGYGYKGTYLGDKTVLTIGASYQYEAEAAYADVANKDDAKDYSAYSLDIFGEYANMDLGTFTFSAAYLNVDFDDAYKGADPDPAVIGLNGTKKGYYVKAGYMVPVFVGPGELQFFGRYDEFQFANLNGFYDNTVKWMAAGVNYYLKGDKIKLVGQYSNTDFEDENPTDVNQQDYSTFEMFLQVRF